MKETIEKNGFKITLDVMSDRSVNPHVMMKVVFLLKDGSPVEQDAYPDTPFTIESQFEYAEAMRGLKDVVAKVAKKTDKPAKVTCCIKDAGFLVIGTNYPVDESGTSLSGNLADYEFHSPEKLHQKACKVATVSRKRWSHNEKWHHQTIAGKDYTLQMAIEDFEKYAQ